MSNLKVVITDYQYEHINVERNIFQNAGFDLYDYQYKKAEELIPVVKDADAIVTQYSDVTKEVIEQLDHCKIIIKYGIGVNNIDVEAATKKGIYVCNVPDYGVEEVSDHAITMILCLAKKLRIITEALKNGDWGYTSIVPLFRFKECKLGLVGFGRIPQLIAKKLSGFDIKIMAYDPYIKQETAKNFKVELADLDTIIKECDFISVHLPLTTETNHLINKESFKNMKNSAIIINTARGGVVCEEDLIEALNKGEIAGAGLDVFETEPIRMNHKLLHMKNVIATPHCAWYSETAITTLQYKVAQEVVNVLQGNKPYNCVNQSELE